MNTTDDEVVVDSILSAHLDGLRPQPYQVLATVILALPSITVATVAPVSVATSIPAAASLYIPATPTPNRNARRHCSIYAREHRDEKVYPNLAVRRTSLAIGH
jgi:hypothetical protein